jgi:hypothetical protein
MKLNDELQRLRHEESLSAGELEMHRHLADDAVRDAVVYEGLERQEAREASKDVVRLQRALEATRRSLRRAEDRRDALLDRLGDGSRPA